MLRRNAARFFLACNLFVLKNAGGYCSKRDVVAVLTHVLTHVREPGCLPSILVASRAS